MLQELLDFIGSLEWQGHKPDAVDLALRYVTLLFVCAAAGYLTGQVVCIYFDIGVLGEQWRSGVIR